MKTIAELAKELNITKTAVRKYLTDDIRNQFAETVSGVIHISETGEKLIKAAFYKNKPETSEDPVSANLPETKPEVSGTVSALLSALQQQLEIKDRQLEAKNKQIEDLQNALEREREHSRQQADTITEKLTELTRNSQILLKQEQDRNTQLLTDGKHRPFWQFWKK